MDITIVTTAKTDDDARELLKLIGCVRNVELNGGTALAKISMMVKRIGRRNSAPERPSCRRCGRPRAFIRKFQLCRICFRELAFRGQNSRLVKASWYANKMEKDKR